MYIILISVWLMCTIRHMGEDCLLFNINLYIILKQLLTFFLVCNCTKKLFWQFCSMMWQKKKFKTYHLYQMTHLVSDIMNYIKVSEINVRVWKLFCVCDHDSLAICVIGASSWQDWTSQRNIIIKFLMIA